MVPLHGIGGAKDLPVPAPLAIFGGTAALVVSFVVLVLAWRTSRYDGTDRSRPLPVVLARTIDSTAWKVALRVLGLVLGGYFVWAMGLNVGTVAILRLRGGPDLVTNPVFGVFYVLLWVGIVPTSLLFGRIYRALSPVRTIFVVLSRLVGADPSRGVLRYPAWLGCWPAALGLFAYVWQELVNPRSSWLASLGLQPGVRFWVVAYALVMLLGASVFGDTWFSRADPFEVYSDLLAKMSPWARRGDGTLVWRSPLANLATLVPRPGLVAVVAVLFGSTAFDSYKDTVRWVRVLTKLNLDVELVNTVALLTACAVIGLTFALATRPNPARLLAHSVVPIIVGYMTAHYLSYFVEQGQITLLQLSDPRVNGSNLFGTANWTVDYWLIFHPSVLASIKVLAVVLGHIVGVVSAHDRALALLPPQHQVSGQIGLLVVMVFYTLTGLYLLFGA
ncbi:MAG: hypothetical protein ACJ72E_10020 [Marmoricola sp.]